jgi:hypothetical protein
METSDGVVHITSSTTLPKNQDVVISWKTDNQEILGYEIRIGAEAGRWDILNSRLGRELREIKLPGLPDHLTSLYVEFGYIVPSHSMDSDHETTENVLLSETPFKISRV